MIVEARVSVPADWGPAQVAEIVGEVATAASGEVGKVLSASLSGEGWAEVVMEVEGDEPPAQPEQQPPARPRTLGPLSRHELENPYPREWVGELVTVEVACQSRLCKQFGSSWRATGRLATEFGSVGFSDSSEAECSACRVHGMVKRDTVELVGSS